jgi:hypothetical protein
MFSYFWKLGLWRTSSYFRSVFDKFSWTPNLIIPFKNYRKKLHHSNLNRFWYAWKLGLWRTSSYFRSVFKKFLLTFWISCLLDFFFLWLLILQTCCLARNHLWPPKWLFAHSAGVYSWKSWHAILSTQKKTYLSRM